MTFNLTVLHSLVSNLFAGARVATPSLRLPRTPKEWTKWTVITIVGNGQKEGVTPKTLESDSVGTGCWSCALSGGVWFGSRVVFE
jgi:hypothetical protein